jgi:hypothetical protein
MPRNLTFAAAVATLMAAAPFAASAQQGGPMGGMAQMGPFTLAQMQERSDGRFTALDTNHDGVLSTAEATPPPTPGSMMSAGRGMERADADHDGNVTLEEYHAMTAGLFARLDANHDGTVTPDELQAMRGMMRPGGGQGGPGGPGAGMGQQGGGMPAGMQMPEGN